MSPTGLEHAVEAFRAFARSSTIPQFSGPFNPLPAETTLQLQEAVQNHLQMQE